MTAYKIPKIPTTVLITKETIDRIEKIKEDHGIPKVLLIEKAIKKLLDEVESGGGIETIFK